MSNWTNQKPTVPGAYYIRGFRLGEEDSRPALVEVDTDGDELICNLHCSNSEDEFSRWDALAVFSGDFEWLGPLLATPPAAQVQGEREAFEADLIKRWKSAHPKAFDCSEEGQKCLFDMMLARTESGEYENLVPREAWQAWQSRAALSAPPAAGAYKDDTRKPHELSAAGCRCVRFGEGNPNWPCLIHTNSAPPASERPAPVYLFRRKGLPDFCTCTAERFEELRGNSLFEVKVLHDLNMPASEQQQAVVLPERAAVSTRWGSRSLGYAEGWNDFRDEFMSLNPHLAGVNQGVTTEAGNGGEA